jgi:hypothetical protein
VKRTPLPLLRFSSEEKTYWLTTRLFMFNKRLWDI